MSAQEARVLVVEDSADLAELWKLVFKREAILAKFCRTGTEAIFALAKGFSPDVIMTDFFLPDMTGAELVAAIQKSGGAGTAGFLVVSGNLHAAKAADFPQGTEFLLKPAEMKDVVQKIMAKAFVPKALPLT